MDMLALKPSYDSLAVAYSGIYASLGELRESFHRSGRLDDSNAKLDEVAKLFATYLAYKRESIPDFPSGTEADLIERLQECFHAAAMLPQYRTSHGHSIFGEEPKLILRAGDEQLGKDLIVLVKKCVDMAFAFKSEDRPFDILNEAFGHFVRDNFRGNVEDAQYMTPPEVVDFMVDMALHDLDSIINNNGNTLSVLDPSCGVGSFLTTFYHRARQSGTIDVKALRLIGQDKVERMARLATINMELFEAKEHSISVGNSLSVGGQLDHLNGTIDIILTNPPFGARFLGSEISKNFGENTPFFSSLKKTIPSVDSELLFIDRNFRLLKEGGVLMIVVPDGVVSAKGVAAMLRQHLSGTATLRAIIELPAVTFAQAGTRTKTSIVYIQKGRSKNKRQVFMSLVKDLGFQVSSRKGVQIKQAEGSNELREVLSAYKAFSKNQSEHAGEVILSRQPSCVAVNEQHVFGSGWTASHYSAERFDAVSSAASPNLEMVPLGKLVDFLSDTRRNQRWQSGMTFLSVLHVIGEGVVDVLGARNYSPKTPGTPTLPGEILFSRINPRIPRICITPDFQTKTLCSSEFEVMQIKDGVQISAHLLMYLLLSKTVQGQIKSLTSGTSASHNRIRTKELASVLVPIPSEKSNLARGLKEVGDRYQAACLALTAAIDEIADLRANEEKLFQPAY